MSEQRIERSLSEDEELVEKILIAYDKVAKNALERILRLSRGEEVEWENVEIDLLT